MIVDETLSLFDTTAIEPGYAVNAQHSSWDESRTGIVTAVTKTMIVVMFHPGIANVVNHFFIPAKEVAAGDWTIRWSSDLTDVSAYPEEETSEDEDEEEVTEDES